jgi:hypothetical protein
LGWGACVIQVSDSVIFYDGEMNCAISLLSNNTSQKAFVGRAVDYLVTTDGVVVITSTDVGVIIAGMEL